MKEVPADLLVGIDTRRPSHPSAETQLRLTIAGVSNCPGASIYINTFLGLLKIAVEVDRFWGDPESSPKLTRQQVLQYLPGLPAGRAGETIADQIFHIVSPEPWTCGLSGPNADGWSITIGRNIRKFSSVRTFTDYWQIRSSLLNQGESEIAPDTSTDSLDVERTKYPHRPFILHRDLAKAEQIFDDGHLAHSALEAFQAVELSVKRTAGQHDIIPAKFQFGQRLMSYTMNPKDGSLIFAPNGAEDGVSEQEGLMWIFMGAFAAYRNPLAHKSYEPNDPAEVWELLVFASMLLRRLDGASARPRKSD
ncbi:TIGR02391 family protein [Micromonospora sp. B9E7]